MTEFRSILPGNATQLERDLELTGDLGKFTQPLDLLRRAKLDAIDSYVPFLIWEYGLGELLPYLKDPRRALSEGILWQRLRGTPKSLVIALDWIDFDAVIEQEETGIYFSEFQLDPGEVIRDASIIPDVIAISRLSAPARSRLSRIYHGYDIRRLKLSEGPKGQLNHHLLSDYSGVHDPSGIRISFGETFKGQGVLSNPDVLPRFFAEHINYRRVYLPDTYRASVGGLSEGKHLANPFFYHSHLFSFGNEVALPVDQEDLEERKYQKAQIVLSDSWEESGGLSDHNGVLAPHWYDVYEGDDLILSDRIELSNNKAQFTRVTTLLRTYEVHMSEASLVVEAGAALRVDHLTSEAATRRDSGLSDGIQLPFLPGFDVPVALTHSLMVYETEHSRAWDGLRDDGNWSAYDFSDRGVVNQNQMRMEHRKFAKAQIVLSDGGELSTLNGVTPGSHKEIVNGTVQVVPTLERVETVHPGATTYNATDLFSATSLVSKVSVVPITERKPKTILSGVPEKDWLSPIDMPIFGAIKISPMSADFYMVRGGTGEVQYADQHWIGITWPEEGTWDNLNVVASMTHTTENME